LTTMARKYLHIDVMDGERYVRTLHMPYLPAFRVKPEDVEKFVRAKCPSLMRKGGGKYLHRVLNDLK